jgi:hypothetical protein
LVKVHLAVKKINRSMLLHQSSGCYTTLAFTQRFTKKTIGTSNCLRPTPRWMLGRQYGLNTRPETIQLLFSAAVEWGGGGGGK